MRGWWRVADAWILRMTNEEVTVIDEEGKVEPCTTCGNPHPGMSHRCTDYLLSKIDRLESRNENLAKELRSFFIVTKFRVPREQMFGTISRLYELHLQGNEKVAQSILGDEPVSHAKQLGTFIRFCAKASDASLTDMNEHIEESEGQ
jgi:hypothetical protein